jgi:hypothetical protein
VRHSETATPCAQAAHCANCGAPFVPERRSFCPECGQETQLRAPTLGEFAQQFGGAYLSTEGALARTLRLLLLKPGELTRLYLAGRRKHYVLPLRLFLTVSLVVLLVLRLTGSGELVRASAEATAVLERPDAVEGLRTLLIRAPPLRLGLHEGVFICEGMPPFVCGLFRERVPHDVPQLLARIRLANERLIGHFGLLLFLLLPAHAALHAQVHRGRGLRYTEHLVASLHLHAAWFLLLPLEPLLGPPGAALALLLAVLYAWRSDARLFGGPAWRAALRAGLVLVLYTALLVVSLAAGWLLALMA